MKSRSLKITAIVCGCAAVVALIAYSLLYPPPPLFDPLNYTMAAVQSPNKCVSPPLLNHSVAPNTRFVYQYVGTKLLAPVGVPSQMCMNRAFDVWNEYLATTSLNINFRPVTAQELSWRFSRPRHLINVVFTALPEKVAGAIPSVTRLDNGYVDGGAIFINSNLGVVNSCLGYYKVGLHEIGHILGLSHPQSFNESSIMNDLSGTDDSNRAIPSAPTACDLQQVVAASRAPRFLLLLKQ